MSVQLSDKDVSLKARSSRTSTLISSASLPYRVESLEPVSPNVPSAAAENHYRHEDDQKIGGVHIVLLDIIGDLIRRLDS
jgi:hypothetical protein